MLTTLVQEILFVNACPMIAASNDQSTTQGFPTDYDCMPELFERKYMFQTSIFGVHRKFLGSRPFTRSWYMFAIMPHQKKTSSLQICLMFVQQLLLLPSRDWRSNILAVIFRVNICDSLNCNSCSILFFIDTLRYVFMARYVCFGSFQPSKKNTPLRRTRPLPPGGAAVQNARLPWEVNWIYIYSKLLWQYIYI